MKKYIASLLLVPFLLVGCNNSTPEPEPKPGDKGEAVLTQEQLDKFYLKKNAGSESKHEKVGSYTIPHDAINIASEGQFTKYEDAEGKKLTVVSIIAAKEVFSLEGIDELDDLSVDLNLGEVYGLYTARVMTAKEDEEEPGLYHYHYTVFDAFGNKYYDADSDSLLTFHIDERQHTAEDDFSRTYYSVLYVYDNSTEKTSETVFKYKEDLTELTKVEKYYPEETLVDRYSFKFGVKEGEGDKEVITEYKGNAMNYGGGHTVFTVVHQGAEKLEEVKVHIPTTHYVYASHYVIYQESMQTDEHDLTYDYVYGQYYYNLKTYVLDLASGEKKTVDFPYFIKEYDNVLNTPVDGMPLTFSDYGIVVVEEIQNRNRVYGEYTYVIDSSLILHDELSSYKSLYKVGNRYFDNNANVFYDANKVKVATLEGVQQVPANRVFDKVIVVTTSNVEKHGLVDENGKYLVPARYNTWTRISSSVICFYNNQNDFVYFDIDALKDITPEFDDEVTYVKNGILSGYWIARASEEGEKDKLFFLSTELLAADPAEALSYVGGGYLSYGNFGAKVQYEIVTQTNEDGDQIVTIYRLAFVYTSAGTNLYV